MALVDLIDRATATEESFINPMINRWRNEEIFADRRAKLRQTQIAKKHGVNQGSISRILGGKQSLGTYVHRERELYPLIKRALQRDARRNGRKILLDILAVRNGQDHIPDLAGLLARRWPGASTGIGLLSK